MVVVVLKLEGRGLRHPIVLEEDLLLPEAEEGNMDNDTVMLIILVRCRVVLDLLLLLRELGGSVWLERLLMGE